MLLGGPDLLLPVEDPLRQFTVVELSGADSLRWRSEGANADSRERCDILDFVSGCAILGEIGSRQLGKGVTSPHSRVEVPTPVSYRDTESGTVLRFLLEAAGKEADDLARVLGR